METAATLSLIGILLSNVYLLGASRLPAAIRVLGWQGVLIGVLVGLGGLGTHPVHAVILGLVTAVVKGGVMPRLLATTVREVHIRREIEPYVGQTASLVLGAGMIGLAFRLGDRLGLAGTVASVWWLPTAFSAIMAGLFLLVARRKAVTQVIGYLVMENGIVVFAAGLVSRLPLAVEIGILLDVFAGVFIMGILLNHIRDVFSDLSTDNLAMLKD